ncbi:MAG: S46 family peptidase, partial [Pyrinomonadaceae bacterium]
DFSFLRAYVAPDGSSAQYSPNNVPFKPRKFLTVSLNGVNENDFVFVLGNPGGTTRYRESQSISYAEEVNFPFLYQYLTAWIGGLEKVGEQNEDKRISLQSFVAQLRNGQKLYGGSSTALRRGDAVAKRKAEEIKFQTWAVGTPTRRAEYGNLLSEISAIWKKTNSSPARDRLLRTIPSNGNSPVYTSFINAVTSANSGADLSEKGKAQIEAAYNNREPIVERGMLKFLFSQMEQLPENQRFAEADNILAVPGSADKLIAQLLDSGDFDTPEKIFAIYSMKPSEILAKWGDLAKLAIAQGNERINIQVRNMEFAEAITPLRLRYLRGMSEMQKITPYPDANFTQRFTYGNVEGYLPREAVIYEPFTSLKGVLEKDTAIPPFAAPEKLRKMQATKDFGRYAKGDTVPVNFLSTTDIIGGNSGSPVLNAYGEQVGLVFDANYEGLGNDLFFDPAYGRTISVDIRYVFFITEKFDNMNWIINEIKFAPARSKAKKRAA